MIQIAAPALPTSVMPSRGPAAVGASLLAFALPGAPVAGMSVTGGGDAAAAGDGGAAIPAVAPDIVTAAILTQAMPRTTGKTATSEAPHERQDDAAPGSDLPEGASDDLRFLAALLPGVPLPVPPTPVPDAPAAQSPVVGASSVVAPRGKAKIIDLPIISTVTPPSPSADAPEATPAPVLPLAGEQAPTPPAASAPPIRRDVAADGLAEPVRADPAAAPAAASAMLARLMTGTAVPIAAAAVSTPSAARMLMERAIDAGVRIETAPGRATAPAPTPLLLAETPLPANWQTQAAPIVAVASAVPVASPVPIAADPAPVAMSPTSAPVQDVLQPQPATAAGTGSAALPPATDPAPLAPPLPATPQPAGIPFATSWRAADDRDDRATTPADLRAAEASATAIAPALAVAAASAGDQATLDLSKERWPHAMVAHIEALRDAADAADTRIRLIPDALGSIDIGVRQDGDTLHVHFTAAEAQTRTLLQDAQPRLAEAAEQRGLKLGQSSVGADAGQQQPFQRQPPSQPSAVPDRPASAFRPDSSRDDDDDARLA